MTPDRRAQVERVCLAVLDVPAPDRARVLDDLCQGDRELREEAEALLAGEDAADALLRTPAAGTARAVLQAAVRSSLVGRALGPYRIEAPLGAGGMGRVYRAHDSKLGRAVALKVLPPEVAGDPQRLARFEREARLLAGVNHPAILTIHDVGVQDEVPYVVTELLEGETLREALARRQPPWPQALGLALQAAQGLAAAHRQGIVHRDLKPENLFLTRDGRVKILDFGLAKRAGSPLLGEDARDTTTAPGLVVGTVAYMAPEQLNGEPVDARADVFAFGIVLYELLTRRHPFRQDTPTGTLDAILHASPPSPVSLVPALPPAASGIVERCLAKAPDARFQDASTLAHALAAVAETSPERASLGRADADDAEVHEPRSPVEIGSPAPPRTPQVITPPALSGPRPRAVRARRWLGGVAAAVAAAALGAVGARWLARPDGSAPVVRSELSVRPAETVNAGGFPQVETTTPGGTRTALRWTPDGAALVFVGRRGDVQQLFVRALDADVARPLAGTEGASVPAVSPDGEWIAFWAPNAIKKIALAGGPVVELARLDVPPSGLVWDHQGRLLFTVSHSHIEQVGAETPLTTLAKTERSHVVSSALPDARTVLFTVRKRTFTWGDEVVEALDLPTGRRKVLLREATDARYVPTGHLLFLRDHVLFAVPIDLREMEVTGAPTPILQDVAQALSGGLTGDMTGAGQFDVAATGALAWIPRGVDLVPDRSIVAVDLRGQVGLGTSPSRDYGPWVRVSPDGRQAAVSVRTYREQGLWLHDVARGALVPLVQRGEVGSPLWSRDGRQLYFHWLDGGEYVLARQPADTNAQPEVLAPGWFHAASEGPEGELVGTSGGDVGWDVGIVRVGDGRRGIEPLLASPAWEGWPELSPDGRWLAYVSNASGRYEVYVQPYPGGGAPTVVSLEGGISPAWHAGGTQLFYLEFDYDRQTTGRMMVVEFASGSPPRVGRPRLLFEFDPARLRFVCRPIRCYDVARDGTRFYVVHTPAPPQSPVVTHVSLVQNWFEELRAKVPVGR